MLTHWNHNDGPPPYLAAIERELGRPVDKVYSNISQEPIAAASLGQVYRATLAADGRDVAVKVWDNGRQRSLKWRPLCLQWMHDSVCLGNMGWCARPSPPLQVQRPGVVEMIAMDVYILRYIAMALRQAGRLNTDLPALVDEWATSLFK